MRYGPGRHRLGARRLCRRSSAAWCASRSSASSRWSVVGGGGARPVQDHAAGLPAGGGPGRLLRRHAPAGGRLAQPHRGAGRPGRGASSSRFPACRACCRSSGSTSSTTSSSSNSAFFVVRLKPYDQRTAPGAAASTRSSPACGRKLAAIQGAIVFPFNLPPILGLGSTGGFQYVLQALQGQSPTDLAAVTRAHDRGRQPAARARRRVHAPSPPTRRRSISISTATRRRCWASR